MRETAHLEEPVLSHVRKDFTELRFNQTVEEALTTIREKGMGEQVVYFYVVDEDRRLIGVLPTRRLLTSQPGARLREIMVDRVVAIPRGASLLEACELFVLHRFLGFPVVDDQRRILGTVDIHLFTDEVFDIASHDEGDDVFEALGFRVSQVRAASPWRAFRFRFPWLLSTIASGTICALLASAYEMTLSKTILLAFFLTLVLALGESVSVQSMTVAIQALRSVRPTLSWFAQALRRELKVALLLGAGCGVTVLLIICLWRGISPAAFVVGFSVFLSLGGACLFGLCVPALLHALRLDPKIAAGPVTLALTDIVTILVYFNVARLVLG
jgi:magnesium transporter